MQKDYRRALGTVDQFEVTIIHGESEKKIELSRQFQDSLYWGDVRLDDRP